MKWIKQRKHQTSFDEISTQLTLADKISRLTIHCSSAQDIAQKTVVELGGLMPIDWASMALIDKAEEKVSLRVLTGNGGEESDVILAIAGTPIAWVAENKQALFEQDLTGKGHFSKTTTGESVKTQIHMPLIHQGEVFGVLTVSSYQADAYDESHMRVLRYTAIHLAIALKGFLLLDQNLKTEASLTDLGELLDIITSSAEIPEVFPRFADRLRKVVHFDHLSLSHIEGNVLKILAVFSENGSCFDADDVYPIADSAVPWLQEHGEMNVEVNLAHQSQFPVDKLCLEKGFEGAIRVPLFSHGQLFASLDLLSYESYPSGEDTDFLKQLAHYLATPVESYILYRNEKQRFDWLNALAHHLKTPLTPIISSSQLLAGELQDQNGSPLTKLAQNILTGAEKLNHNLKVFWDLSEVESPEFSLKLNTFDPRPVISQAAEEAFKAARSNSHSFTLESPEILPCISADPPRILQVLNILLDNSMNTTSPDGKVELRVKAAEKELVFEVADSGQPFSPEDRESLLQPYCLSEADQRSFPQLTLNLAICRRLIELHGGRLWISSGAEEGNIFGFSLPVLH